MCGRLARGVPVEELADAFDVVDVRTEVEPSWNVAPTDPVVALRVDAGGRVVEAMRWGLVPHWSDGPDSGYTMINARAETVHDKPAYRGPFRSKRCTVLATGFYEWRSDADGKTPMHVRRADGRPLALAGLWDEWTPDDGETVTSCTIVTTTANTLMASIHDRMPVVLDGDDLATWLDPDVDDVATLQGLLGPCDDAVLEAYAVSTEVNPPTTDGPRLVEPVDPAS